MERGLIKTSAGYIHYRAAGQGRPILLLHAAPRSSTMFLDLMEVLQKGQRVIAIDSIGYGMSDPVQGNPLIRDYAQTTREVMDGLGLKKASLLGESSGAFIAIEMANVDPDRVERIILANCPFWPDEQFKRTICARTKAIVPTDSTGFPLVRALSEVLEKDPLHSPMKATQTWMDRDNRAFVEAGRDLWKLLDAIQEYDLPSNLERLECPALVVWGDHFFYARFQNEIIRRIRNAATLTVKGGRFLLSIDHADELGQEVLKFLSGMERQ